MKGKNNRADKRFMGNNYKCNQMQPLHALMKQQRKSVKKKQITGFNKYNVTNALIKLLKNK